MTKDQELLQWAAKAADYPCYRNDDTGRFQVKKAPFLALWEPWSPLADDADALRLAVKLGLSLNAYPFYSLPKHSVVCKQRRHCDMLREANPTEVTEVYGDDPCAATRRAIVRAAAEIAKAMP
jgi:hypothetical protein